MDNLALKRAAERQGSEFRIFSLGDGYAHILFLLKTSFEKRSGYESWCREGKRCSQISSYVSNERSPQVGARFVGVYN